MIPTSDSHIILYRAYTPRGTFGELAIGDLHVTTIERPWLSNIPFKSCIPEGVYPLQKRESEVVRRTSRGRYHAGWEITNVPARTQIMFHVANLIDDIEGCVGVAMRTGVLADRLGHMQWGVVESFKAFCLFMEAMEQHSQWTLDIRTRTPEYP